MSFHSYDEKSFEGWKRGIEHEHHQPGWDIYDNAIHRTVAAFDHFNAGKSGYIGPRWSLIKAVLWVEGGGPRYDAWKTQPMQIGWKTDTGIVDVLTQDHIGTVTPPDIRRNFSMTSIKTAPEVNIQAGLALLHLKLATFSRRPKLGAGTPPPQAAAFRAASGIATIGESVRQMSGVHSRPGLKSGSPPPKAKHNGVTEAYVSAWLPFHPVVLYQKYNIGDGAYARKLEFCMSLFG